MLFSRIDHIALDVCNSEKTVQFYQTIFGFQVYFESTTKSGHHIIYMKLGDTILEISQQKETVHRGYHFCIHTTNFEKAISHLTSHNIPVCQPPHPTAPRTPSEKGWMRAVYLGPDGELVEIRG